MNPSDDIISGQCVLTHRDGNVRHHALLIVHPAPEALEMVLHEQSLHNGVVIEGQLAPAVVLPVPPRTRVRLR